MHFLVHVVYYSARCKTYKKRGFLEIGTSTKSKFLHKGKETKHDIVTLHKPVVTTAFCVQDRKLIPVLSRKVDSAKYCYTRVVIIKTHSLLLWYFPSIQLQNP
jgi:hypothetical protein